MRSVGKIVHAYTRTLLKYRWLVVIATLAICGAIGSGASNLRTTPDNRVFFGPENPDLKMFEALEAAYRESNDVLIAVASESGDIFQADELRLLRRLTDVLWTTPYVTRVDSIANYQHSRSIDDELIIDDLVPSDAVLDPDQIAQIRETALSEPALVGLLISEDGKTAGIAINFRLLDDAPEPIREIVAYLHSVRADIEREAPGVSLHLTGNIMLMSAFDEAAQRDVKTLVPLMFFVIVVVMAILVRSFTGVAAIMLLASLSTVTAMGAAGWFNVIISAGSSSAPLIILTMTLAYGVHLVTKFLGDFGLGWSKEESIANAVEFNLSPVALTSVTSAIGFLSMNGSDAPPFHDLGTIVAGGVTAAFILSFTFLPAFLSIMKVKKPTKRTQGQKLVIGLGSFVVTNRRSVFWSMLVVIGALSVGISRIELNDDWVGYFDERYEFHRDTEFIMHNLTGIDILEYSIPGKGTDGIFEPSYLEYLDRFTVWLRSHPDVVNVQSLSDVMKRLNKDLNGGDPAAFVLPDSRQMAAQYLFLYELSLPSGLDLNDRIAVDRSATRVTVILRRNGTNLPSKELQPLARSIDRWLETNGDAAEPVKGTGLSLMFAYLSESNIRAMFGSTAIALLIISGILVFALRSVKIGIASLVPNFVPAALGFGLWGFFVGEAGVPASVVGAMTFGIVVDDTIHFLSKYLQGRRELGKAPQEAILYAFRSVGTALTVTTLVLVTGFLVLATSGFAVTSTLGLLTAIVLAFALVADFLFLPSLLLQFDRAAKDVAGDLEVLRGSTDFAELPALTSRVEKYLKRIEHGHPLRGMAPGDSAIELWSNDYLSLSGHPSIVRAQTEQLQSNFDRPAMSGASTGQDITQRDVERQLADFMQVEDAVLCQSGWCANVDLVQMLGDEDTPVYLDLYVHASLWDGARASNAPLHPFRHNRPDSLQKLVERHGPGIVVVDAMYSADGSICPLEEIADIAEQSGCIVVADESHSLGTYGDEGEGLVLTLGLKDKIHYRTASLSKAFATRAGLVSGPARVMEFFRSQSRSMLYSSALLPHEISGLAATLAVIRKESWRRDRLWKNTSYLRRELTKLGYNLGQSDSQVIALEAGPEERTMQLRDAMEQHGIFGAVFCSPATPQNRSLLRLSVNCALDEDQVERIIETCAEIRDEVDLATWSSTKRAQKREQQSVPLEAATEAEKTAEVGVE